MKILLFLVAVLSYSTLKAQDNNTDKFHMPHLNHLINIGNTTESILNTTDNLLTQTDTQELPPSLQTALAHLQTINNTLLTAVEIGTDILEAAAAIAQEIQTNNHHHHH